MNNETKSPLFSKTLWVNAISALLAIFYPPATQYISTHPEMVAGFFTVLNIVLRLVTKTGISIS
jgi:hypothetical protein